MNENEVIKRLEAFIDVFKIIQYLQEKHEEDIPVEIMEMVENDVKEELGNKDSYLTGYIKEYWKLKKQFLSELGYEWESPLDKYPNIHFD